MVLKLHGHPQKSEYASPAEWPLLSAQNHWSNPPAGHEGHDHHVAHTHVELWAPIYGEIPRHGGPFTLKGRIQLFHVDGVHAGLYGWMAQSIVFDDPSPIVGDPQGVAIRTFTVTYDLDLPFNGGSGEIVVPENGWFPAQLVAYTRFNNGETPDTGDLTSTLLIVPLYAKGDPAIPEPAPGPSTYPFIFQAHAAVWNAQSQNGHGSSISEYRDVYVPMFGLTQRTAVLAKAVAYARAHEWPTPENDRFKVLVDPDLHNGVPGTVTQEVGTAHSEVAADVMFDPVALGPGPHKLALIWEQHSGAGNVTFGAAETLASLLVVPVLVGNVPPPQPGEPVDCAGTWGPVIEVGGEIKKVFTPTRQPANGGKSCLLVADESD